ncbi:MAG: Fic family protein [Verrucomicrobiales bacterium]|nr:Fic family protein [Verrucomicrobiales bacterium]
MPIKRPSKPISWAEFTPKLQPKKFIQILNLVKAPIYRDEYLHWDDLRFKPLPENLSAEELWIGLKIQRHIRRQDIALTDANSMPFSFLLCDDLYKELREIDVNVGGQAFVAGLDVNNHETRNRYLISTLIQESITSSQLEGAVTTRLVAKEMFKTGRPPRNDGERMILNNYQTMEFIREIQGRQLTMDLLLEIHRRVTVGTLENNTAAGRLRREDEPVKVADNEGNIYHEPPSAAELPRRVQAMLDFANTPERESGYVHPVVRAMILHFWLAYDHPFTDGNGRTARALFYWAMLHQGYWIFEFISISSSILKAPVQYARAFLETESDENDLNYFLFYHLKIIKAALIELREYVRRKQDEIQRVAVLMRGSAALNYRQQALVEHAMRHPDFRYTITSHKNSHNVTVQTARNDLFGLVDKKILRVKKIGKVYYFNADGEIEEKLRRLGEK